MKKIKLAIVGTGLAALELHGPVLRRLTDRFVVVAVCSRNLENAHAFAASLAIGPIIYTDFEALLRNDQVEAIDIAVPIHLTCTMALAAVQSGKHVFAEKPIADNVLAAERLIEAARQAKVVLMVGENFRYQARFHAARQLVQSGIVGTPLLYRLNDLHQLSPNHHVAKTRWRQKANHQGGYLLDGGVHIVAGMRVMVASTVQRVHGLVHSFNPGLLGGQADTLLMQLVFDNGMIGQLALGYGVVDRDTGHPKIYGDEGTLTLFQDRIEVWPTQATKPIHTTPLLDQDSGFWEEFLDFYAAIADGTPPRSTPEDAVADIQVILAGLASAASGKVIDL